MTNIREPVIERQFRQKRIGKRIVWLQLILICLIFVICASTSASYFANQRATKVKVSEIAKQQKLTSLLWNTTLAMIDGLYRFKYDSLGNLNILTYCDTYKRYCKAYRTRCGYDNRYAAMICKGDQAVGFPDGIIKCGAIKTPCLNKCCDQLDLFNQYYGEIIPENVALKATYVSQSFRLKQKGIIRECLHDKSKYELHVIVHCH